MTVRNQNGTSGKPRAGNQNDEQLTENQWQTSNTN